MLRENLINIYETSFRENYALPALTDYFKQENFTYLEMGAEIAKLHLLTENVGAPFDSVYSEPCCLKTSASAEVFVVLGLLKMIVGNSFT